MEKFAIRRRYTIEIYLYVYFPTIIANLISNYDCNLDGKLYKFDCTSRQQETFDDMNIHCVIHCLLTLHDGRIAIGGNSICKIMNPQTELCENIFNDFSGSVSCMTELDNNNIVVCSGLIITKLQIFNPQTGSCDMILTNDANSYISRIITLSDQQLMGLCFTRECGSFFTIWNIVDGSIKVFSNYISKCHTMSQCVDLFPNGQTLVITNHQTLVMWNPQTKALQTLSKANNALLLSNGQILQSFNGKFQIRNFSGKLKNLDIENGCIFFICELPDERIVYLNSEYKLKVFDLRTNQYDIIMSLSMMNHINNIGILPNGHIVCTSQDGIITMVT